jgi:hypothetical protein
MKEFEVTCVNKPDRYSAHEHITHIGNPAGKWRLLVPPSHYDAVGLRFRPATSRSCSFGGRPGRGAHQAIATLHEKISGGKIEWVLEADLKNFFGSLSHEWMLRFVEHRVGDQRLISLIRRWLKAGVLEDGEVHPSEEGTPQGGSVSVLPSNAYDRKAPHGLPSSSRHDRLLPSRPRPAETGFHKARVWSQM